MTEKIPPPNNNEYTFEKVSLALDYCPKISPCKECLWPRIKGTVCNFCGDSQ